MPTMIQYKQRHGTDFDREDELIDAAKGWKEIALKAQTERDELRAALIDEQKLTATLQAQLEEAQAETTKLKNELHQMTHDAVGAETERDKLREALKQISTRDWCDSCLSSEIAKEALQ